MLFNSLEFITVFLPIVLFGYFFLNKARMGNLAKIFLILASFYFYSYVNFHYAKILFFSLLFNYAIGCVINSTPFEQKTRRKIILFFGVGINLLLLGYYKYADFFINNINNVFASNIPVLSIALPLGISFFTFTQVAYLVDSYQGKTDEYDLLNYALFVTFFPHLIAGPILHHKDIIPQFASSKNQVVKYKNIAMGFFLFSIGLFKKIVLADTLSSYVHFGYDSATSLSFIEAWIVTLAYTFQIYFDFSGYTDMALGVGRMFNIRLPENFNSPYKSKSVKEFWRRWHITLSRFLKDYLYIPLGGSRNKTEFRTYVNLLITFLLCGLWHGASWMFVLWGLVHGIAVCVNRIWDKFSISIPDKLAVFSTFLFVNFAFVFFRADNWATAKRIYSAMFGKTSFIIPNVHHANLIFATGQHCYKNVLILFPLAFILVFCVMNSGEIIAKVRFNYRIALIFFLLFFIAFIMMSYSPVEEFLYFNF